MAITIVWFRPEREHDWGEVYTLVQEVGVKPSYLRLVYRCMYTRIQARRILGRLERDNMAARLPLSAAGRSVLLSTMFAPGAPNIGAQIGTRVVEPRSLLNNPNLSAGARRSLIEEDVPNISGENNG